MLLNLMMRKVAVRSEDDSNLERNELALKKEEHSMKENSAAIQTWLLVEALARGRNLQDVQMDLMESIGMTHAETERIFMIQIEREAGIMALCFQKPRVAERALRI